MTLIGTFLTHLTSTLVKHFCHFMTFVYIYELLSHFLTCFDISDILWHMLTFWHVFDICNTSWLLYTLWHILTLLDTLWQLTFVDIFLPFLSLLTYFTIFDISDIIWHDLDTSDICLYFLTPFDSLYNICFKYLDIFNIFWHL